MTTSLAELHQLVRRVPDPEIPLLTIEDLGILRGIEAVEDGRVIVTLTPTYLGCPAVDPIADEVRRVVRDAGHVKVEVRMALAPAWSTEWITDEGRAKLLAYGIAPPERIAPQSTCARLRLPVRCPRCGSVDTRQTSRFAATPCQAQHVCNGCLEPFHSFKAI